LWFTDRQSHDSARSNVSGNVLLLSPHRITFFLILLNHRADFSGPRFSYTVDIIPVCFLPSYFVFITDYQAETRGSFDDSSIDGNIG
jgi:hypothetical protein